MKCAEYRIVRMSIFSHLSVWGMFFYCIGFVFFLLAWFLFFDTAKCYFK
jgi:hypothetical protein